MGVREVGRASDRYGVDFSIVWTRNDNGTWTVSNEEAQLILLCEIRDELKKLNRTLQCPNFLSIPRTLKAISRKLPGKPGRPPKGS